jgi:hypothetical protein
LTTFPSLTLANTPQRQTHISQVVGITPSPWALIKPASKAAEATAGGSIIPSANAPAVAPLIFRKSRREIGFLINISVLLNKIIGFYLSSAFQLDRSNRTGEWISK